MLNRNNLHNYQLGAIRHIKDKTNSALFLDMGLGKSISTLTAINDLIYDEVIVSKVLVIAPLRVANTVWHNEAKKWEHTKELKFSIVTGSLKERQVALQRRADVYVINRENTEWLVQYLGSKWDFDMLVVDESSSFKNPSSKRFKALKKVANKINRIVLLTGTPASNGYMDLWSQFYLLDGGYRLGRTIAMFRDRYFNRDFMGFSYTPRDGAIKNIQDKIQDLVLSMSAKDHLELPEFIPIVLGNNLDGKLLEQYKKLERDMILAINNEKITAVSAGVLTNKLLQFCSGNMYNEANETVFIHDLKIETLKEIIDGNPDENILIAYNYKHELDALSKAFPNAVVLDKKGKSVDDWNKGNIKILLAHPASAGHGLNLQSGGSIIVWYGFTWSLELYKQFNARLYRQGQTSVVRCFHIAVGEVEYRLMMALSQKDMTQDELLSSLK